VTVLAFTGCFGATAMHTDIQEYNKQIVSSEQEMLLYNIGRLHYRLPPHFMMLASIAQTREFSTSAAFQWSQVFTAINPITTIARTIGNATSPTTNTATTTSSTLDQGGNWQAGPFSAEVEENPTIQFVPVQGAEFAQRFESSMTQTLVLLSEEQRSSPPSTGSDSDQLDRVHQNQLDLLTLMAENLYLLNGDDKCPLPPDKNRLLSNEAAHREFQDCLLEVVKKTTVLQNIDAGFPIPTKAAEDPKAADVVTALLAGYEWDKVGDKFTLTSARRIPAWFDFDPSFVGPPARPDPSTPVFWIEKRPSWRYMNYKLPKNYAWYNVQIDSKEVKAGEITALLPDGYELKRNDTSHRLELDAQRKHYILVKSSGGPSHTATGRLEKGDRFNYQAEDFVDTDKDRSIIGKGIPSNTFISTVDLRKHTVELTHAATESSPSDRELSVGDLGQFWYGPKVVHFVWPVANRYFYFELRHDNAGGLASEQACFRDPAKNASATDPVLPTEGVVCGYFEIGTLLEIMQRLSCAGEPLDQKSKCYDNSIFGIGTEVPKWADTYAPFEHRTSSGNVEKGWVWVPNHDPGPDNKNADADRDRRMFLALYKLYQLSLVDTSKLVSGITPVTISK